MSCENEQLSNSRAYAYSKCRQFFKYKYIDHVQIQPKDVHIDSWTRMNRGILIHAAMEAAFLGHSQEQYVNDAVAEQRKRGMSVEQEEAIALMAPESLQVAKDAQEWLPVSDWEPLTFNGMPTVEMELKQPLPGWKAFVGYADLVAKHKPSGINYLIDYKCRATFEPEGADAYNQQFALYLYALEKLGVKVGGSLLFEIKPVVPKRGPRYSRTDTGSIDGVRVSSDGRFRTSATFRSSSFVNNFWDDFKRQALAIAKTQAKDCYRNMSSFNCGKCEYNQLCMGELGNHDVKNILDNQYTVPKASLRIVNDDGADL